MNGVVAVGAPGDDDNGSGSGSAYLFDAATGEQIAKLLPSIGGIFDLFGWSIAMENDVVIGGAPSDIDRAVTGSAYLFDTGSSTTCVADLTGDEILNYFDVSSFLIAIEEQAPVADFDPDGIFDISDVLAFLDEYLAGCP